jgi:hypothetical protein
MKPVVILHCRKTKLFLELDNMLKIQGDFRCKPKTEVFLFFKRAVAVA